MIVGMGRREVSLLLAVIGLHLVVSVAWLLLDQGLLDGDELGVLGAVELFWGMTHSDGVATALAEGAVGDYGEYPPLHYALTGIPTALLGVEDLDGDGPMLVGLGWGVLALLATAWLATALGRRAAIAQPGRAGVLAAALLASSPLWTGMQRHLLLENALVAFVALAAAAWTTVSAPGWRGPRQLGLLTAVAPAAALLVKQTAALALLPFAIVDVAARGDRRSRVLDMTLWALVTAIAAGPWYLRHLMSSEYLADAAEANPDAVGWLHQLAIYPLALSQLGLAVAVWAVVIALIVTRRPGHGAWRLPALVVLLGVLLLLPIPKKYPRLLMALLPFFAAALALALDGVRGRARGLLYGVLAASLLASSAGLPILGPTYVGLGQLDERCPQRWATAPSRPGLPWDALIAGIETAAPTPNTRVSAISWPAPPCGYQTSHDLGEHLRIRMRRAGSELEVAAGDSFVQADGWSGGPPDVLLHDGELQCGEPPGAQGAGDPCAGLAWREVARIPWSHPAWSVDFRLSVQQ